MLPDAPQLDRLLRIPLTVCLGLGIAAVLRSLGFAWAIRIEQGLAILVVAVALEVMVRSLAVAFVPFAPLAERRSVADSSLAGFLRFSAPSFQAFNTAVRQQFGIDLSRSWALAFVQRALLPVTLVMGILAWCVTGITALGLNERAVYERFGEPVAVFGPGLHLHLPWPMGVMRYVELGVIHDIPIAMSPLGDARQGVRQSAGVDQQQQLVGAEAAPPAASDRLWDASHPSEQSYLIASQAQRPADLPDRGCGFAGRLPGRADRRAMPRIAAYRVADPETLIMASTGQLLVRYFARYTLPQVLGQSRDAFTTDFRAALQDQLDRALERHRGDRGGGRGHPSAGRRRLRLSQRPGRRDPGQFADRGAARERHPLDQIGAAGRHGGSQQGDRGRRRAGHAGPQRRHPVRCRPPGARARRRGVPVRAPLRAARLGPREVGDHRGRSPPQGPERAGHRSAQLRRRRCPAGRADATSCFRPGEITAPRRTTTNPAFPPFQDHADDARAPSPPRSSPRPRPS